MMKILYITTIGTTMGFFKDLIEDLIKAGHSVDIATNESESPVPEIYRELGCKIYPLACERTPFHAGNWKAIRQIRELVEKNEYDIVHCHTPVAATCTRLACRKARKRGVEVYYTAHGFHFYKGAPLRNWLLYYPVEWICAYFTDVLITMNREDFHLAQKRMHAKRVKYVRGVGINLSRFQNVQIDIAVKRKEIGIPENAVMLISVGELIKRKNHKLILQALTKIDNQNIHYVIVGKGPLRQELQEYANTHNIGRRVHFLGYRKDIAELYKASDICCFPSFHEGLPVALMEAMACGVPAVCSNIRGNTDLIAEGGGLLFSPQSVDECCQSICNMLDSDWVAIGKTNAVNVQDCSIDIIIAEMKSLYTM